MSRTHFRDILLIALVGSTALGQSGAPAFEVASIKPTPPEFVGFQSYVKGDRYTAMTASLRNLIGYAYGILDFQIAEGPAWASTDHWNIDAKIGTGKADPRGEQAKLMLQSLLTERFGLKFHRVTKKRPGYAVVIDKGGPKLVESSNPRDLIGPAPGAIRGLGVQIRALARELSSQLESPVEDRTGLTARYDFTLSWTADIQAQENTGPSLFTAIRDQLGLRLERVKDVPVDLLVIERAHRPSEN